MAFEDLTDTQQEGIRELWDDLAGATRRADALIDALQKAHDKGCGGAYEAAVQVDRAVHWGYAPMTWSEEAAGWFDGHAGPSAQEQADYAKKMADTLVEGLAMTRRAARAVRDELAAHAAEVERLAAMADEVLD